MVSILFHRRFTSFIGFQDHGCVEGGLPPILGVESLKQGLLTDFPRSMSRVSLITTTTRCVLPCRQEFNGRKEKNRERETTHLIPVFFEFFHDIFIQRSIFANTAPFLLLYVQSEHSLVNIFYWLSEPKWHGVGITIMPYFIQIWELYCSELPV